MKKIILILCACLLVGCTNLNISSSEINTIVKTVLESNTNLHNTNNIGYRYYLPRDFSIYEEKTYNQTLINNGNKYFLTVDIISYYNKSKIEHKIDNNLYFSYNFSYGELDGFVDIKENNNYFYIKMMYNYSVIEVSVQKREIKDAISYMTMILSSIKYNDSVIKATIGENILDLDETSYVLEGPKKEESSKNFLDYVTEFDNYEVENNIEDPDLIN